MMHKYVYCVSVYVPVCALLHVWHSPRVRAPPDGRVCGAAQQRHAFAGGDGARLRACTHTAGLSRSSQAAGDDSRARHAGRQARVWQGTHTRGRARPLPRQPPRAHVCTRVPAAGRGTPAAPAGDAPRRSVRTPNPPGGEFWASFRRNPPPLTPRWLRCGGEQRAPAGCAHACVPPQHAGDRPSLYLLQHKHLRIPTAA